VARSRLRNRLLAWLGLSLVLGLAAVRLSSMAKAPPTDFDDAYMYMRYAHNLLAGEGMAWNPGGGAVYGATSLLHLAVLTALGWLFASMGPAGLLAVASGGAAVGLLAALVAIPALHARHSRLRGNWIFWAAIMLPLVAYREAFGFHAGTGMDTMLSGLANAFVVFTTLRLVESAKLSTVISAAVVAILAVLARPDNAVVAIFCPVLALALLAPRPRARHLALYCALALSSLAVVALAEWSLLGSPLPLSFFAKQPFYYGGFAGEFTWNPFLFLEVFFRSAWPFVIALILFADRDEFRRAFVLLVPALASMAILFRFNQIMGHLGRFYYPFLPFFVASGTLAFDAWLGRLHRGNAVRTKNMLARAGAAVAVLLVGELSLSLLGRYYEARASDQRVASLGGFHVPSCAPLPEIDSWRAARDVAAIAVAAPAGSSFAMSEHGLPGALAPRITIIDVLGLHDPYFAHHGFSAVELFRRKPDVIWMPHPDHTQMIRDILDSDTFWSHYVFYPDAFFHGIALRIDGANYARLAELLGSQWRKAYPGLDLDDYRASRGEGDCVQ
jgi:arabinofuranosyltransferase